MKPYEVDHNGWTWVPVVDILQNADTSVDFDEIDWEYIIKYKSKDTGFMHLVEAIMTEGWQSAIGYRDGYISEGHHRLVAAILLCEELIPTTQWGTDLYDDDGDWCRKVSGHSHRFGQDPAPLRLEEFV